VAGCGRCAQGGILRTVEIPQVAERLLVAVPVAGCYFLTRLRVPLGGGLQVTRSAFW
jgi:hypothetical protein